MTAVQALTAAQVIGLAVHLLYVVALGVAAHTALLVAGRMVAAPYAGRHSCRARHQGRHRAPAPTGAARVRSYLTGRVACGD